MPAIWSGRKKISDDAGAAARHRAQMDLGAMGNLARRRMARLKYWQKLLGMAGGHVRAPLLEISDTEKRELRSELEMAGVPIRA